ncbi:MAG: dienelactone hydrolase family protein [Sphingomonas sp.]
MTDLRQRAIALYDAFTHEHRDRRTLMKQMAALAGSMAAAEALVAGIAASPAAASISRADDPRLVTGKGDFKLGGGKAIKAYTAEPRHAPNKLGAVMVIHENRGLNAHIEDVTRRLALAGFIACAPDLLSDQGGTPADEDQARDLIARIDIDTAVGECLGVLRQLARREGGTGKVGTVGFCWGGGMVNRVAIAAGSALDAAVAYYGPAPNPAEAAKVQAPMLLHYAGLDTRVDATGKPWVAALQAAGKQVTAYTYPGVNHAFNNDTAADRYNADAAKLAWGRTVDFLHRHLDGAA